MLPYFEGHHPTGGGNEAQGIIQDLKKGEGAPGNIYTRRRFITDGDGDDINKLQINSNMRDARNLSISGWGGEERNLMEPTKKDTFFVAGLLYREFAEEHTLNETVGRAQSFSIVALLDSIVSPSSFTAERSSEAMAANPSPVSSHTTDPAL